MEMTDEYAAQYFHKMGWMWGRLEVLKEQETWGDLRAKRIEIEVRESIVKEIQMLQNWKDETGAVVLYKDRVLQTIRGNNGD